MARSGKEFDVLVGANDVGREPTRNSAGSSNTGGRDATTASAGVVSPSSSQSPAVSANGANLKNGASLLAHVTAGQGVGTASTSRAVLADMVKDVIDSGRSLDSAMAEIEAAVIRAALKQQHGNRSAAARQLQLPRQTLQDRMKKHGLWSS